MDTEISPCDRRCGPAPTRRLTVTPPPMLFAQIRKRQQELQVVQRVGTTVGSRSPHAEGSVMIYEERIYTIMPGKMADIERRFADHTLKLFEKHEIKVVGFWKTAIGRQTFELVYILQYKDLN